MWWAGWTMVICNTVIPHVLWFKKIRTNVWALFVVSIFVNIGMWFERYVIIVIGLHRDFMPSSWGSYAPSYVEVLTMMGSFGLFMTLFLLFCRYLPMVAIAEVKGVLPANVVSGLGSGYAQNKDGNGSLRRADRPWKQNLKRRPHKNPSSGDCSRNMPIPTR